MKFTWHRGASFALALRVIAGSVTGSETIRCVMKRAVNFNQAPGDASPEAIVFDSEFVAASGDQPAHWLFTAAGAASEALTAGIYLVDARMEIGGDVIQTTPVRVDVVERITGASA